jgi:transcription elongation factor Elf1
MKKILDCPCCGSNATLKEDRESYIMYFVQCKECGLRTAYYIEPEKAIGKWNLRVPTQVVLDELKEDLSQEKLNENLVSDVGIGLEIAISKVTDLVK